MCASVIVGLNTEAQVRDVAAMMEGVQPRTDLVERAFDLWRDGFPEG